MKMIHRFHASVLAALSAASFSTGVPAQAPASPGAVQSYPSRPIRIVIGFTPGGGPDITARLIGQRLTESWKQQVVVDNRPGAGGTIAAQTVARANPDGHTLLSVSSAHAVAPAVYARLPYDTLKDFASITLTANGPALLIASPTIGVKTVKDLIALARSKPGQLNFSSAGIGSGTHFAGELLRLQAGIDVTHVPFKGIPEAITETITGRVQFFISPFASVFNLVKEGKAHALAVTSAQRMALTPDLPTVSESGLPGYRWDFWYAMLAPAKLPQPVIRKLNDEITRILRLPDTKERWVALGAEPTPSTPAELDKLIAEEIATYAKIARAAGIKPQ
jgi:tripartite-type tricarboxylate transporter receptor subunit TctC